MTVINSLFGSGQLIATDASGGKRILEQAGFFDNNTTNPWLPDGGSYSIRFLSPSTFSVFGFEAVSLSNANSGNCFVKNSCASNEFNCLQNNITRAISNSGSALLMEEYSLHSLWKYYTPTACCSPETP